MKPELNAEKKKLLWILWGAMFVAVVVFAVVGSVVPPSSQAPPVLAILLSLLAVVETVIVLPLARMMTKVAREFLVYCILRWALCESIGIYGLLIKVTGGDPQIFYGLVGWSLLLLVITAPRAGEHARFAGWIEQNRRSALARFAFCAPLFSVTIPQTTHSTLNSAPLAGVQAWRRSRSTR